MVCAEPEACYSFANSEILNVILIDIIYFLLLDFCVVVTSTSDDVSYGDFEWMLDAVRSNDLQEMEIITLTKKHPVILTRFLNKTAIASLMMSTSVFDYADSCRFYAICDRDYEKMKSGDLVLPDDIEQWSYQFYISPSGDTDGLVIVCATGGYETIIEKIKTALLPYALPVIMRE